MASFNRRSDLYDYFSSWSEQLSRKDVKISAFVIMPNHVHLLVYLTPGCKGLNKIIGDSKRFFAYEIVKRLEQKRESNLLDVLKAGVQENERKKGKKHQVF